MSTDRNHRRAAAGTARPSRLGPMPLRSVATLADLGLDDGEIARYYRVDRQTIARLRRDGARLSSLGPGEAVRPASGSARLPSGVG